MNIFVVADLHLSFFEGIDKPMDIFGPEWKDHAARIKNDWISRVSESDTVIIPGDISWGLKLSEAVPDLDWIKALPGKKVAVKGNHDLWWGSISKLNDLYKNEIFFIQNNYTVAEDYAICGTRGWICPEHEDFTEHDKKLYVRELQRLETSLSAAKTAGYEKILAVLHFPPANDRFSSSGFIDLFREYGVKDVVYGHLHNFDKINTNLIFDDNIDGINYKLTSIDYLECRLWQFI